MVPDSVIFLVGLFVTIIWGSGVGLLLYAALRPDVNSGASNGAQSNNLRSGSEDSSAKASNV